MLMTPKLTGYRVCIQMFLSVSLSVVVLAAAPVLPQGVIKKLSSDQYEVREKAYAGLHQWAVTNMKDSPEVLYQAWKTCEEPEAKTRCYSLMEEMVIQRKYGRGKGFVGIRMEEFLVPGKEGKAGRPGIRVSFVLPDTPAAKAGLKVGDVVLGVDDLDFSKMPKVGEARIGIGLGMGTVLKFSEYIQSKQPDDVITLHLMRAGKVSDMKIKLMKRPASADEVQLDPFGRGRGR